jgi:hypothetical protein
MTRESILEPHQNNNKVAATPKQKLTESNKTAGQHPPPKQKH